MVVFLKCLKCLKVYLLIHWVTQGQLNAQGKLLQQDTFSLIENENSILSRPKERRVFLFEQLVILSEPIDRKKGFSLPGYIYKNSIKVMVWAERARHIKYTYKLDYMFDTYIMYDCHNYFSRRSVV